MFAFHLLSALAAASSALAIPVPLFGFSTADDTAAADAPTSFSLTQANDTLLRPALFARVAYCPSAAITAWDCGVPCQALKNITFLQSGGDQGAIPLYYIAHSADDDALVVAHEGTDAHKLLSILNDAQFGLVPLNETRFPETAGQNITVHDGFQQTFERTADGLLSGVLNGLQSTGVKKVLVTGHSLGAALATMTGTLIKNSVPADVEVTTVGFGLPRGGNQAWADFLDTNLGVTFVTNQNDPVPVVPPQFLGFVHSQGEIHITSVDDTTGEADLIACPGQDNTACSTGNSILDASVQNHLGPYFDDISFGGGQCTPPA